MLKKRHRGLSSKDISACFKGGRRTSLGFFSFFVLDQPTGCTRFAVAFHQQFASTAVERNRFRRRVCSLIEKWYVECEKPLWVVIFCKPSTKSLRFEDLSSKLCSGMRKAGLAVKDE